MRTAQDIVNNCLNPLEKVRFAAEGCVPEESLARFDETIQETATKLKGLGDLESCTENQISIGAGLSASDTHFPS